MKFIAIVAVLALGAAAWAETPPDMVWIPAGQFTMGTDDPKSMANERPAHAVKLDGFWIDVHDVTNAQFGKFVAATGYQTTAERPIDWNELKKQVAPGTPKPPDDMLQPGSLVFTPPDHPVDLTNMGNWWTWTHRRKLETSAGAGQHDRRQRRIIPSCR